MHSPDNAQLRARACVCVCVFIKPLYIIHMLGYNSVFTLSKPGIYMPNQNIMHVPFQYFLSCAVLSLHFTVHLLIHCYTRWVMSLNTFPQPFLLYIFQFSLFPYILYCTTMWFLTLLSLVQFFPVQPLVYVPLCVYISSSYSSLCFLHYKFGMKPILSFHPLLGFPSPPLNSPPQLILTAWLKVFVLQYYSAFSNAQSV